VYTLRILNKTEKERRFELEVDGEGEFTLIPDKRVYVVKSGEVYSTPMRVRRPAYEPLGPQTIEFELKSLDDESIEAETEARFLAPTR